MTEKSRILAEELSIVQTWATIMESETIGCCLDVEPSQESAEELNAGVGKLPALELRRSSCNREGRISGQTIEMEPQAADQQEPQAVDQQARKIEAILKAPHSFIAEVCVDLGDYGSNMKRIGEFSVNIVTSFFLLDFRTTGRALLLVVFPCM